MDLCLRGSQINLAARQRPKPKYSSQTNLNRVLPTTRPRSATLYNGRSRSSPFLYRPQSAEPKFGRACDSSCGLFCSENEFQTVKNNKFQKRYQSISSSNLLKLLLDEPIKRSWLCRSGARGGGGVGAAGSSPDNQSELSSSRKSASNSSLNRRQRCESAGSSSAEGEQSARLSRPAFSHCGQQQHQQQQQQQQLHQRQRRWSISKMATSTSSINRSASNLSNKDVKSAVSTAKTLSNDYWLSGSAIVRAPKPDLPGRVSFCKGSTQTPDVDSSDCDNDKQEQQQQQSSQQPQNSGKSETNDFTSKMAPAKGEEAEVSISAPGPLTMPPSFQAITAKSETDSGVETTHMENPSTSKKSVHFVAAGSTGEVYAETYEYPKCPSENCSCSTRSSSTASIHDVTEGKCACSSPSCRYVLEMAERGPFVPLELPRLPTEGQDNGTRKKLTALEESAVIREYKNTVGEQLENSIVKSLLLEDGKSKVSFGNLNNLELPNYLNKYSAAVRADVHSEMQNNLSDVKNTSVFRPAAKRNLLVNETTTNELPKITNNQFDSTSESVINNYLKVTAGSSTTSLITKKKDNTKSNSADSTRKNSRAALGSAGSGSSTTTHLTSTTAKIKALNAKTDRAKLKKATSFGSLRDDTNLNEFNLDKVDSWMSMHHEAMASSKSMGKLPTEDRELEQIERSLRDELDPSGSGQAVAEDREQEEAESVSQFSSKSEDNSQDDSTTYDEIVSVIKEIEEDKNQDNLAERSAHEMELKLNTPTSDAADSTVRGGRESRSADHNSPDKYKDILSYLDNVEDSCDKTLLETRRSIPESNRSEVEFVVEPDIAEDVPKLADLLLLPNHQLARRVISLSLRANELSNAVVMAKEHVGKVRLDKQKSLRNEKGNTVNRLREQKKHYETIVKRHQTFIEQLLKDKGSLCEKMAALTRRLESQNLAWEHKLETELTRARETTMAGEKIRRERWVRENTKKIKELTVKGLETEINRMTSAHQQEISDLKRSHQQQILDAVEEARLKHEQIENGIRESCAQDREMIIEKERTAIRERFERQLEEERKTFDEHRQKLCDDFTAERDRLQQVLKVKEADYQMRRQEMQHEKEQELEHVIAQLQDKMSRSEEKYQNRINTIEKQYEADFELWKREYENSCKLSHVEKENTIRQHYRTERDRQIDAIVTRMDAEAQKNSEEFEVKVERLKEKYEKDLKELEKVEHSLREKYAETRSNLAESDAQVRNHQAEVKQLQIELIHSKKMCGDFLAERDQLRENLRREIQNEVATLKAERDAEIQRIHKRVQQAIEKKDATIDILQKENGGIRERCLKLEAVIRQQRKDYCIK